MPALTLSTPVGLLTITQHGEHITRVRWRDGASDHTPLLDRAACQIAEYFDGTRTEFALPLSPAGSEFQKSVCAQMQAIPLGETRTYGEIARVLGVPAQAVGQACGGNPIPILIPCHRVLGASGLGGFSGGNGIETKIWLLRHEGAAGLLI